MTNTKSTKRALLMSGLALLMCVSMLIGSTYAWFTDSVTSAGNKIQAGTLQVDLVDAQGNSLDGKVLEFVDQDDNDLWEPGCTYKLQEVYVKNIGTLALKYEIAINGIVGDAKLLEAIEWTVTMGNETKALNELNGFLLPNTKSDALVLSGHMKEEAGNEYQGLTVEGISISVVATQYTHEYDSFGKDYDKNSKYPTLVTSFLPENRTESTSIEAGDVTVEIPADAPAGDYKLTVDNTSVVVDEDGNSVANFEIDLTRDGQSVNSDGKEYTITIFVAKGLNPDTTKLYHKGVDITSSIISASPVDGTVTFKTDSFSPFAVEYKVDCDIFVDQDQQTGIKTIYVFTADGFEQLNKMMADKTAGKDAVVKLCANIDMTGKTWTPVDSHADTAFYLSELDGQGFTISNLTINGQAMFKRFAGFGDVTIKDVTFYNATVNSTALNSSILTVQTYQNTLLDNVDIKGSAITGAYKVAPLVATVYDEKESSIVCTVKNCDVSDTVVTSTVYDFFTCGMISFVYTTSNDYVEYENCSVTNVQLKAVGGGYDYHANIHYTSADTDVQINEHPEVKVTNVTFESIG